VSFGFSGCGDILTKFTTYECHPLFLHIICQFCCVSAAADHVGIGDAFAFLALIFVGYSFINFVLVCVNMYLKKRWLRIVCIAMLALNVLLLV